MWNLKKKKMMQMNIFTKAKQAHRLREGIYGGEGWGRRDSWEFGTDMCALLCLKWIMSKDPLRLPRWC